jgi:YVTN family beta-propeller protein
MEIKASAYEGVGLLRNIKVSKLLSTSLIIFFALSIASMVYVSASTSSISVGASPTGIAYDTAKGWIYVVSSGTDSVSVISDSTNSIIKTIPVGSIPTGIVYDSGKSAIYVTNHGSNSVSVISDSSNLVTKTIMVGTNPNNIAYDSGQNEIFVVNAGDNSVSIISDSSNLVLKTVSVGTNPNKAVYDSAMGEVFVCNSGYNTVSVISDVSNSVTKVITVGSGPAGGAYDSGMNEIFIANSVPGTVSVISDRDNSLVATINVGTTPYGIAYDPITSELFVVNHGASSVSIISDTNNSVVSTLTVGAFPTGVIYDSVKGTMYITNEGSGTISVISDSSVTVPSPTPSTSTASSSPSNSSTPTPTAPTATSPSANPSPTPTQSSAPSGSDLLQQVWVPKPTNAAVAVGVSAAVIAVFAGILALISNPLAKVGGIEAEKTEGLIPDKIKEWLEEVIASRREVDAAEKTGSVFKPTGPEIIAYIVAIIVLGISFAYVKVITLSQIWVLLPVFIATSVIVGFVQKFVSIVYLRSKGVWSEHSIWPLGLFLFLFTTFAFRVPFSSPTRSTHSKKFTERLGAIVAVSEILISLAFAGLFFLLLKGGFTAVGDAGLSMCVIGSFFGTFPVSPMSGKDIFNHSKRLWAGIFIATLAVFVGWLLML